MESLAGTAVPARRRRGTGRARTSRSSPRTPSASSSACSTRRPRDARRAERVDRAQLALLPPRRRPGPALRLPRPRPVRPAERPPLQPQQAPHRPLREGDRRAGANGTRANVLPYVPGGGRGRRPRARRRGRRRGDPEVRRHRPGLRLGGRRAAADAVERDGHLRDPRQGLHAAAPGRSARTCAARTPALASEPAHRLPPGARRHGGRAAPDPPHRRRGVPARPRPDELLGLLVDRLPRAARPLLGDRQRAASRCASSRGWSRRCTARASR